MPTTSSRFLTKGGWGARARGWRARASPAARGGARRGEADARNRTWDGRVCNPSPYHLATSAGTGRARALQRRGGPSEGGNTSRRIRTSIPGFGGRCPVLWTRDVRSGRRDWDSNPGGPLAIRPNGLAGRRNNHSATSPCVVLRSRSAARKEGEGFEPPKPLSSGLSGFRDRRVQPLRQPSGSIACFGWTDLDSNQEPPGLQPGALPIELPVLGCSDGSRTRVSWVTARRPTVGPRAPRVRVPREGFEPPWPVTGAWF